MRLRGLFAIAVLVTACSSGGPPAATAQPGGATAQPGGATAGSGQTAAPATQAPAGGGGASLVAAAAKVKDVCTLVSADVTAKVIPSAPPPQSQTFPPFKCTYFDDKSQVQVQVTLSSADTDVGGGVPAPGTVPVPGLGAGATVVSPATDEVYLTVKLSADQGGLYVDIYDPSHKDRKDDAILVAQAVLQKLGG